MLTKSAIEAALTAAKKAPRAPTPVLGCGHAFVRVSGTREEVRALAAACRAHALTFLRGASIYMGYDDIDGEALGRARKFAAILTAHGLTARAERRHMNCKCHQCGRHPFYTPAQTRSAS